MGVNELRSSAEPRWFGAGFIIGKDFIGSDSSALVLGDNVFYGQGLSNRLRKASGAASGASVFAYHVSDPERFGVVSFNEQRGHIDRRKAGLSSRVMQSQVFIFYDNDVLEMAAGLKPSARGERNHRH